MSDSEEPYTVVDELEEGEIVDNGSSAGTHSQPKKQKTFHGTPDSKCIISPLKNKTSPNKKKNGIAASHKSTSSHKAVTASFANVSIPVLGQPTQSFKGRKRNSASSKKPDSLPMVHEPKDRFPHKQQPQQSTRGRVFETQGKDKALRDVVKSAPCNGPVPQLDLNSSYDDLLKHHKEIQRALAKLEQEQKKSRKKCPHKSGRRHLHGDGCRNQKRKRDRSLSSTRVVRMGTPKAQTAKLRPTGSPVSPKTKSKGRCKLHAQKGKRHSPSSGEKTIKRIPIPAQNNQDEDELEQLRLNALLSVPSKTGMGMAPNNSDTGPNAVDVGGNKENTVPNGGSSAFSASGCHDDYSVVDMEVDDDRSNVPQIFLPSPQRPQSPDLSDDDIEAMRERLLQSLRKAREPDSTTGTVGEETGCRLGSTNPDCSRITSTHFTNFSPAYGCDPMPDSSGVVAFPSPGPGDSAIINNVPSLPEPSSSGVLDVPVLEPCSIQQNCHSSIVAAVPCPNSCLTVTARSEPFASSSRLVESNSSTVGGRLPSPIPSPLTYTSCNGAIEVPVVASTSGSSIKTNPTPSVSGEVVRNLCHKPSKVIPKKTCPKPLPQTWTFMKQKPVIINLNEDTTEESDSESSDEGGVPSLNCLEELIRSEKLKSSYRQSDKSSEPKPGPSSAGDHSDAGPKPTLSDPPITNVRVVVQSSSPVVAVEPRSACIPKDLGVSRDLVRDYNMLCKKLALASDTFKKEQQLLAMKKINANKKKSAFINSQLVVQRLKEQLAAAEKVKNTNTRMMFVANAELETVQGSVLKRALLVKQMREQCHRLEEQISSSVPFSLDVILNAK